MIGVVGAVMMLGVVGWFGCLGALVAYVLFFACPFFGSFEA